MSIADIAVVGIILLAGLTAFSQGFVRVVLALLGWVGAAFATLYGFQYLQPLAQRWISVGFFADAAAAVTIFLVTLILLTILSHAIGRRVRDSGLSALDRSVGLLFGFALGAVLVSLAYLGVAWAIDMPEEIDKQPQWIQEARSRPLVKWGAAQLQALAPAEWSKRPRRGATGTEQTRRRFEKLIEPEAKSSGTGPKHGYTEQERKEMDRLIRGQR